MKLLKLAFRREMAVPTLALTFASGASVALIVARVLWTGNIRYVFLVWNLFLAWVPLILALLACEKYQSGSGRNWRFYALSGAWAADPWADPTSLGFPFMFGAFLFIAYVMLYALTHLQQTPQVTFQLASERLGETYTAPIEMAAHEPARTGIKAESFV